MASYMTLVHHNLVYMVLFQLLKSKESLLSREFAQKLAEAKTDSQLDELVKKIQLEQLPSPMDENWNIPTLEQMEVEVMHLISYWNDFRVSFYIYKVLV